MTEEHRMRAFLTIGAILVVLAIQAPKSANAIGCLSGGAMGAIAGHQVHHGVMGAIGGCVAGHYAHKHAESQAKADADAKSSAATQTSDGANAPAPAAPGTAPTKP
jgi:outer membrane lipoprotein SlyB